MATTGERNTLKANFAVQLKYDAFYTGGHIQFSEDGDRMFCKCGNQVKVINVETGAVVQLLGKDDDEDKLSSFVVSSQNQTFVLAYHSGLIQLWNSESNECFKTWKSNHKGPIVYMTVDGTSNYLATGGTDSKISVWDMVRNFCTHSLKGAHGVFSIVQFHADAKQLVGAASDCRIHVWDLFSSKCTAAMEGHNSTVTSIIFSKDGNQMLSSGRDQIVILWDFKSYQSLKLIPAFEIVESIVLLPEKSAFPKINVTSGDLHFITAGSKGILRVWKASTSQLVYSQQALLKSDQVGDESFMQICQAAYIPSQNSLAVTTNEQYIVLLNLEDLSLIKQFVGYNDEILDMRFMGKEESHLAIASNSRDIKIFNLSSSSVQVLRGHTDIVLALSIFSSNPMLLGSASKDTTIRLWLMDEANYSISCIAIGLGHTAAIGGLGSSCLNADFLVSGSQDRTLKVWDIPRKVLAAAERKSPYMLRARFTQIAHEKDINSVAVSRKDNLIASGSQDKTAKIWDVQSGKNVGTLQGHRRGIWCIEFAPKFKVVATSSSDMTIKLWNLNDHSCLTTLQGHDSSVLKVAFISDGRQLLSSGTDGLLKLWTIKLNECVKTFDEHKDKIWALAVNGAESLIATGGADSTIIVWKDVTEQEWVEEKKKNETLILQEQVLQNLLHDKKYMKALALAITLEQPFRALTILKEILKEEGIHDNLDDTLSKLTDDQIEILLKFATKWNTNSKNCFEAQRVLNHALRRYEVEELLKLAGKDTIEAFIPFTERHIRRIDDLFQQSMFLDYTLQCLKLK